MRKNSLYCLFRSFSNAYRCNRVSGRGFHGSMNILIELSRGTSHSKTATYPTTALYMQIRLGIVVTVARLLSLERGKSGIWDEGEQDQQDEQEDEAKWVKGLGPGSLGV